MTVTADDAKGRTEKRCPKCGVIKAATVGNFPRTRRPGKRWVLSSWCRECHVANKSARTKAKNRLRRYGLSVEKYEHLESVGYCRICGTVFVRENLHRNQPVVDHDHSTGLVRGVICRNCNIGIGYFLDSPARLESAAVYLRGLRCNVSVHSEPMPWVGAIA